MTGSAADGPGVRDDEDVWRRTTPHVLAALIRRYGHFEDCEDAVQLALEAATVQWPEQGRPDDPAAWLLRVASRRMIEQIRRDRSRRRREEVVVRLEGRGPDTTDRLEPAGPADPADDVGPDADALNLMLLCCHESLSRSSQVALMLRAVAGLSTRQIASGFMVPEATMGQRISRAKAKLTASGARFEQPGRGRLPERILAVRHAITVLYTQGHLPFEHDLTSEVTLRRSAIALARELRRAVPGDPENSGLLALLLLSEARAAARTDAAGDLVPLADQDRGLWDRSLIAEGVGLLESALPAGYVGTFQLQASIAAVHAEAETHTATDWVQILVLYEMLERVDPSTAVRIGWATALSEVRGPRAGLAALEGLEATAHHRYHAVRGHLLSRLGEHDAARRAFEQAARLTRSIPEQRYLNRLLVELGPTDERPTRP